MKGFKKDENSSAKPSEYLIEYADTLQELTEIIRSYLDIADEYLQDMIKRAKETDKVTVVQTSSEPVNLEIVKYMIDHTRILVISL